MIFVHCLRVYVALWISGQSVCLVNSKSLVQIRAAPNIEMMQIRLIIVFTKFICLNDFYPLCPFVRGAEALWLKRLSRKQEIPGSNPRIV